MLDAINYITGTRYASSRDKRKYHYVCTNSGRTVLCDCFSYWHTLKNLGMNENVSVRKHGSKGK